MLYEICDLGMMSISRASGLGVTNQSAGPFRLHRLDWRGRSAAMRMCLTTLVASSGGWCFPLSKFDFRGF